MYSNHNTQREAAFVPPAPSLFQHEVSQERAAAHVRLPGHISSGFLPPIFYHSDPFLPLFYTFTFYHHSPTIMPLIRDYSLPFATVLPQFFPYSLCRSSATFLWFLPFSAMVLPLYH